MKPAPKILIHSIVFSPDGVSTAYLYNDIALKFKEKGYEVVVLTTTPHYNRIDAELKKQPLTPRLGGLFYESNFNGIRIKGMFHKRSIKVQYFECWGSFIGILCPLF